MGDRLDLLIPPVNILASLESSALLHAASGELLHLYIPVPAESYD